MKTNLNAALTCLLLAAGLISGAGTARADSAVSVVADESSPAVTFQFSAGVLDVLKLVDAKIDVAIIQAYIKNSAVAYNPNATEIIALKNRGVAPEIITAILERGGELRAQRMPPANAPANPYPEVAPYQDGTLPVYPTEYAGYGYPIYSYGYPGYSYSWYDYGWPYYRYPYLGFSVYNSRFHHFNHFDRFHRFDGFHHNFSSFDRFGHHAFGGFNGFRHPGLTASTFGSGHFGGFSRGGSSFGRPMTFGGHSGGFRTGGSFGGHSMGSHR
jgi:hypothetical protein